ncbi:MAG: hypothetical protein IJO29_09550 [Oscillospiraceae bacterium]|nr:hypothetical protein [Oscillospiraceae bacterium]
MKKITLYIVLFWLSILMISCEKNDCKLSSESGSSSISLEQNDDSQVDVAYEFATESEAVEYYYSQIQAQQNKGTFQTQSNGSTGIYVYSLENIPQGFTLGQITGIGSMAYYNDVYRNADNKSSEICAKNAIYLRVYHNSNGEEVLQDNIDSWRNNGYAVNEISNKSGYYYVDCELSISVYWCEDGYCCLLQIPTSVGTVDLETHEYSGEDVFTLKKTFYPFDDNTVAE